MRYLDACERDDTKKWVEGRNKMKTWNQIRRVKSIHYKYTKITFPLATQYVSKIKFLENKLSRPDSSNRLFRHDFNQQPPTRLGAMRTLLD